MPGNPSLRRALRALAAREESGKGRFVFLRLSEEEKVRHCFRMLKNLSARVQEEGITGVQMNELSMGMSSDYRIAIEEGSTIVRVGTAIFGARPTSDSYYWPDQQNK